MRSGIMIFTLTFTLFLVFSQISTADTTSDQRVLFEETCSQCHSADIMKGEKRFRKQWADTVNRMRDQNGLLITDKVAETIIDYLTKEYGK